MKTNLSPYLVAFGAVLVAILSDAHGAVYTWNGGGGNNEWGNGDNWAGGVAPTATNHSLVFAGGARLGPVNSSQVTSLNGITFAANALAFSLSGDAFDLRGDIVNRSAALQTIGNNIRLAGGNYTVDTGSGGVTLTGAISQDSGSLQLFKNGAGVLTLSGVNSFLGNTVINAGTLVLNAAAGGSLAGGVKFGDGTTATQFTAANAGGTFKAIGASSGSSLITLGALTLGYTAGGNEIIVDSNGGTGTVLQFTTLTRQTNPSKGFPTLHIDLSSPNSSMKVTSLSGVQHFATVNFGSTTALVNAEAGGTIAPVVTTALAATGNSASNNYHTSGDLTITASASTNTLTISAAGSVGSSNSSHFLQTKAIMMQEGAGNFTIGTGFVGAAAGSEMMIHQYSLDGTLTIQGGLGLSGNRLMNNAVVKTGKGAVIYTGNAINLGGVTDLHSGLFQNDGTLGATSAVQVRSGATLGGSGTIGGGAWTVWNGSSNAVQENPRETSVTVYSGGTIDATNANAKALEIVGSLTLHEGANFKLDLASTTHAALHVEQGVESTGAVVSLAGNLALTLTYAPILNEVITLLTTDGEIEGSFSTINGLAVNEGLTFGLSHDGIDYGFLLAYSSHHVTAQVLMIPESGLANLFACGVLIVGFNAFHRSRRGRRV